MMMKVKQIKSRFCRRDIMGMWKYRYTCSKTGVKVYQFEHTNQYMIVHPDGTVEYQRD